MSDESLKYGIILYRSENNTKKLVDKWMKEHYGVETVGVTHSKRPANLLTKGDKAIADQYKSEVLLSLNTYGSRHLAIIEHQDCTQNRTTDEEQIAELKKACDIVKESWELPERTKIIGLWLTKKTEPDWEINCIVTKQIPIVEEISYA